MIALVAGDIHYPRESYLFAQMLDLIKKTDFDYILLCGDILNYGNIQLLRNFLKKIHKYYKSKIIAVMGNHDFWLSKNAKRSGYTSWDLIDRYNRIFRSFGDYLLWKHEYIDRSIGFAGVPGWYDYSFAPWHLGITRKMLDSGFYNGMFWNDFQYTKFNAKVEEILEPNLINLRKQFESLRNHKIKKVIVLLHFVPLEDFIIKDSSKKELFWNAYIGSRKLGDLILEYKDIVRYVFFGHVDVRFLTKKATIKEGVHFINVDVSNNFEECYILEIK